MRCPVLFLLSLGLVSCHEASNLGPPAEPADASAEDSALPDVAEDRGLDTIPVQDTAIDEPPLPEPYEVLLFDRERISSDSTDPNFQTVTASYTLTDAPFSSVRLKVDLDTTCFPFETWAQNPPPPGENWPADCDAFDRNFEVTLDEPQGPGDPPAVEVVRAITPFGGPMQLDVDVTDVANGLPGEHRLQIHITTWSDAAGQVTGSNGGWSVSATLEVTPGVAPRNVLAVIPLLNTSHDSDSTFEPVSVEVPAGAVDGRIEYRATGHGGGAPGINCVGPAEEFCRRTHNLSVDGTPMMFGFLWRTNCQDLCTIAHYGDPTGGFDYCVENPCGAIQSVRAPRANWCPGSVTPPSLLEGGPLGIPGTHTLEYQISTVLPGGSWRLSAVYFGFGP